MPDSPRTGFQIGDHDMVGIFSVFEEGQLLSFYRILRDWTPHEDKPMGTIPLVWFVPKLPNLPPVPELLEPTFACPVFDGRVLSCNDGIAAAAVIEKLDDSLSEEAGVATNAHTRSGDLLWNLFEADSQERDRSSAGASISRSQRSMPELLQMSLEAEKRMIRSPAAFLGIVANSSELDSAADCEDHRIEIER